MDDLVMQFKICSGLQIGLRPQEVIQYTLLSYVLQSNASRHGGSSVGCFVALQAVGILFYGLPV